MAGQKTKIRQIICMLHNTAIGQKPVKVLNKVGILNIRYDPHNTVSKHLYVHFCIIIEIYSTVPQ